MDEKNGTKKMFKYGEEIDRFFAKIYNDTRSLVAYSSFSKLYRYIKRKAMYYVLPKYLKKWLSKQESYTSFHLDQRTFRRPKVLAFAFNYQWNSDTVNRMKYKKKIMIMGILLNL